MAKSLKTAGVTEAGRLRQRVIRQHSMGRISKVDRDRLVGLLDEFQAHVIRMEEKDDPFEKEVKW